MDKALRDKKKRINKNIYNRMKRNKKTSHMTQ